MTAVPRTRILFDATRLVSRAGFATPTGIDRVDLVYAEALRAAPEFETQLIVFDALGAFRLGDAAATRLLAETAQRWRSATPTRSAAFAALTHWLAAAPGAEAPRLALPKTFTWPDPAALRRLAARRHRAPALAGDAGALYVNTSHGRLFDPGVARWLHGQRARGVFFVHDLIPIEHPEFNRPGEAARHAARLRLIAREAQLVIVNSEATRAALQRWWQHEGLAAPAIAVIPLGVAEAFLPTTDARPAVTAAQPYFVVLGTIEPRKNHALLLHLWRRLASEAGPAAPRLVVIGRRGWENETVFNLLDRTPALRPLVAEASGLADAEIAALLRGARALLAPSFAEGYGLPVVEALAAGTPVIASDLPAHREIGGAFIEALDPLDGAAWWRAIRAQAEAGTAARAAAAARLAGFRASPWPAHAAAAVAAIRAATAPREAERNP